MSPRVYIIFFNSFNLKIFILLSLAFSNLEKLLNKIINTLFFTSYIRESLSFSVLVICEEYTLLVYFSGSQKYKAHFYKLLCMIGVQKFLLKISGDFFPTALILALKALQEKIHRLELERTQAEDNLTILSREAAQYKKALDSETNERNLAQQELMKQKKGKKIQQFSETRG